MEVLHQLFTGMIGKIRERKRSGNKGRYAGDETQERDGKGWIEKEKDCLNDSG